MASTKSKKKPEIFQPGIIEPIPEIIVDQPKDKIMHANQLRQIEVSERDVHNARLTMAVEEQTLRNLILESKYLVLAIEKQRALVDAKAQAYELEKKRYETISKDILALHGLEGAERFAYDTNTGKIII